MKKILILIFFFFIIFINTCLFSPAASGKGLHLGINIGQFPIEWHYDSWLQDNMGRGIKAFVLGGEIGYQFTKRIAILGEFAYGNKNSLSRRDYDINWYYETKMTYSSMPISLSLFFITPLDNTLSTYIGLGLGYYTLKYKWKHRSSDPFGGRGDIYIQIQKIRGFAPHINLGIESVFFKRLTIFGELRHIVGKAELKEEIENGNVYISKRDVHFGGSVVKIGVRFHFKNKKFKD